MIQHVWPQRRLNHTQNTTHSQCMVLQKRGWKQGCDSTFSRKTENYFNHWNCNDIHVHVSATSSRAKNMHITTIIMIQKAISKRKKRILFIKMVKIDLKKYWIQYKNWIITSLIHVLGSVVIATEQMSESHQGQHRHCTCKQIINKSSGSIILCKTVYFTALCLKYYMYQ